MGLCPCPVEGGLPAGGTRENAFTDAARKGRLKIRRRHGNVCLGIVGEQKSRIEMQESLIDLVSRFEIV